MISDILLGSKRPDIFDMVCYTSSLNDKEDILKRLNDGDYITARVYGYNEDHTCMYLGRIVFKISYYEILYERTEYLKMKLTLENDRSASHMRTANDEKLLKICKDPDAQYHIVYNSICDDIQISVHTMKKYKLSNSLLY